MALNSKQKEYIRKNARYFSIETLASDLGVESKIIEKYLKKIWRRDKYLKYISKDRKDNQPDNKKKDFVISEFILKNIFIFVGLFLLVFICYFNSLGNGFVSDDIPRILNNPNISSASNIFHDGLIGSFQKLLYFLSYKMGGLNPSFFRFFNIFFHTGSVWLVFIILSILSNKRIAILTAVLFAIHPLATESVAWISGSPYSIGSFFALLTLIGYILKIKMPWQLLFLFLALVNSEKAIVFPLILILYDVSFYGTRILRKNWKKIALFFGLSVLWAIFFLSKLGGRITSVESSDYQSGGGLYNPLLQIPVAISNYLILIFWPDKLTLYHTEMSFSAGEYLLFFIIFLIVLAGIYWGWKKNRAVFFWLSLFIVSLAPTLTPLKIAWIVAERYVYFGSIGIFVVLAIFLNWIYQKAEEKHCYYKYAILAFCAAITIALSVRTIVRNIDWKNEDNLWFATVELSPSGQGIHNNLGDVYARQGNMEKSIEEFKKAIEINPHYAEAYHNLANIYRDSGNIDLAIENYNKALKFNPTLWQSHQNLAAIYYNQDDFKKTAEHLQAALKIDPQNKNLQENLQVVQEKLK